jgi:hypothetical protein
MMVHEQGEMIGMLSNVQRMVITGAIAFLVCVVWCTLLNNKSVPTEHAMLFWS